MNYFNGNISETWDEKKRKIIIGVAVGGSVIAIGIIVWITISCCKGNKIDNTFNNGSQVQSITGSEFVTRIPSANSYIGKRDHV